MNDRRSEEDTKFVRSLHIHLDLVTPHWVPSHPEGWIREDQPDLPWPINKRVEVFQNVLAWSCSQEWAKEGDEELEAIDSTYPTHDRATKISDGHGPTQKRVQTINGNGYLISCTAPTLHDHKPSSSNLGLETRYEDYFCPWCAYVGHLLNELWPTDGQEWWGKSACKFHSIVRTAIQVSLSTWHPEQLGRYSPSRVNGQATCLEKSLISLRSALKLHSSLKIGSKRTVSEDVSHEPNKRQRRIGPVYHENRTWVWRSMLPPLISPADAIAEELDTVVSMLGQMHLSDK